MPKAVRIARATVFGLFTAAMVGACADRPSTGDAEFVLSYACRDLGIIHAQKEMETDSTSTWKVSYSDKAGRKGEFEVKFTKVDGNWEPTPPLTKDDCP